MNDEAYRIFGAHAARRRHRPPVHRGASTTQPDIVRMLAGAFELTHLPNRAELRLKSTGKVIGYTLSQVRTSAAASSARRCSSRT